MPNNILQRFSRNAPRRRRYDANCIANGGSIDTAKKGVWVPLEVVELGRNWLQPGHEREFALCAGITLKTARLGDEAEQLVDFHMEEIENLPVDLRTMIEDMVVESMD